MKKKIIGILRNLEITILRRISILRILRILLILRSLETPPNMTVVINYLSLKVDFWSKICQVLL